MSVIPDDLPEWRIFDAEVCSRDYDWARVLVKGRRLAQAYAAACVAEARAPLVEALTPFAAFGDRKLDGLGDDHVLFAYWWDNVNRRQMTVGDVKRAAALAKETPDSERGDR
jgi:hypothetical protein